MLVLAVVTIPSCASKLFRERQSVALWMSTLERHRSATTIEDALRPFAEDYRRFLNARAGEGLAKDQVADSLRWELALHRSMTFSDLRFDDVSISARCHLENDFSRLIDHPGWRTTITWWFDDDELISTELRVPDPSEPDFRNWLAPAIAWLRLHRPADLDWLYPAGEVNRSPGAAERWVEVLTEWRAETGRSEVLLGWVEPPPE